MTTHQNSDTQSVVPQLIGDVERWLVTLQEPSKLGQADSRARFSQTNAFREFLTKVISAMDLALISIGRRKHGFAASEVNSPAFIKWRLKELPQHVRSQGFALFHDKEMPPNVRLAMDFLTSHNAIHYQKMTGYSALILGAAKGDPVYLKGTPDSPCLSLTTDDEPGWSKGAIAPIDKFIAEAASALA